MNEENFILIPMSIFENKKLSSGAKNLYGLILGLSGNGKSVCYASNAYLAEKLGILERQVQYSLKELIQENVVSRTYNETTNERFLAPLILVGGEKMTVDIPNETRNSAAIPAFSPHDTALLTGDYHNSEENKRDEKNCTPAKYCTRAKYCIQNNKYHISSIYNLGTGGNLVTDESTEINNNDCIESNESNDSILFSNNSNNDSTALGLVYKSESNLSSEPLKSPTRGRVRRNEPSPYATVEYLQNLSTEALDAIAKEVNLSVEYVEKQRVRALNWLEAKQKKQRNYKQFFNNWLLNSIEYATRDGYSLAPYKKVILGPQLPKELEEKIRQDIAANDEGEDW